MLSEKGVTGYGNTLDQNCLSSSEMEYLMPRGQDGDVDDQDSRHQAEIEDGSLATIWLNQAFELMVKEIQGAEFKRNPIYKLMVAYVVVLVVCVL